MTPTDSARRVDPAMRRARTVVGLYGDPDVTWSIVLEVDLTAEVAAADLRRRVEAVAAEHAHLGRPPVLRRFAADARRDLVEDFANTPYGDGDAVLRVGLADDGRTLVLGAHHGAVDGLGLVGLAGLLIDRPLGTSAQGVRRTGAEPGFLVGSVRRLGEALFRPPERFASPARHPETGDWLSVLELPARRLGTADLVWVATRLLVRWNGRPARGRQPVVAIGVSRRPGQAPLRPDRDTAYTRLRTRRTRTRDDVAALLRATQPEPDFPETDGGGIGPLVTRLLASRLGASVLVSNLGVLDDPAVAGCRFWPTASGPNGVGVGLVTAGGRTALTLRVRRGWFTAEEAQRLLDLAAGEVAAQ